MKGTIMAYQDEILETFKTNLENNITNKKVRVATSLQNDEQRKPFGVVISIGQVVNINPMLDDYQFIVDILIDFFIKDDLEGHFWEQTKDEIWDFIEEEYLLTRMKLTNIEEGIVGCFLDDKVNTSNDVSNREIITLQLVMSKD